MLVSHVAFEAFRVDLHSSFGGTPTILIIFWTSIVRPLLCLFGAFVRGLVRYVPWACYYSSAVVRLPDQSSMCPVGPVGLPIPQAAIRSETLSTALRHDSKAKSCLCALQPPSFWSLVIVNWVGFRTFGVRCPLETQPLRLVGPLPIHSVPTLCVHNYGEGMKPHLGPMKTCDPPATSSTYCALWLKTRHRFVRDRLEAP